MQKANAADGKVKAVAPHLCNGAPHSLIVRGANGKVFDQNRKRASGGRF
jgi:hypothetical protein